MDMKKWRLILFPFALIYGIVIYIRNKCFDWGILKSQKLQIPSVGVGNLAMGGTGKSILIDYLITQFKLKYKIAVLSRGYGRKTSGVQIANKQSSAVSIGDEPYQFFKKHKGITVAVAEKRILGVIRLLKEQPGLEVLFFDDMLQHRAITPSLMVLTTTYYCPYFKDRLFPVGNLREGKVAANRAEVVLVTKCPSTLTPQQMHDYKLAFQLKPNQHIFFTKLHYNSFIQNKQEKRPLSDLKAPFVLVTGIADPAPIIGYLKSEGLEFKHLSYPDHHLFTLEDLKRIRRHQNQGFILTTEKDFTRLGGLAQERVFYLSVKLEFFESKAETNFKKLVSSALKEN